MKRFYRFISRLYDKKVDASGLAIFRIGYGIVLFCEVLGLFQYRHLVYDEIPFIKPSEIDATLPLLIWLICIIFLVFGLFTRPVTILNYLFSLIYLSTLKTYEYHMFYTYMGLHFLLMFMPVSRTLSLDRLRLKLKYSNSRTTYNPPDKVSVLNYTLPVLMGIGLVYFDSVFYKFTSHLWLHGLGMWLPSSIPHVTNSDASFILNQQWLMLFLGYFTVVFEILFVFLFWRKKWRITMLCIGMALHLGIVIQYPIPWFGLGCVAIYLLLVPISWWKKAAARIRFRQPMLTFFYDEECPLCARTKIILRHFDALHAVTFKGLQSGGFEDERISKIDREELLHNIYAVTASGRVLRGVDVYIFALLRMPLLWPLALLLKVPGISHLARGVYARVARNRNTERCTEDNCGYTPPHSPQNSDAIKLTKNTTLRDVRVGLITSGLVLLMLFQANSTYNSPLTRILKKRIGFTGSAPEMMIRKVSLPVWDFTKICFGITSHGVFMDAHFDHYNHIVAVEYIGENGNATWLPIIDQQGHPDKMLSGSTWVKWTFRVNQPAIDPLKLREGIRDFTAYWMTENNISFEDAQFRIHVKRIDIPTSWQKDFLREQINKPWVSGGTVYWSHGEFHSSITDIEAIP